MVSDGINNTPAVPECGSTTADPAGSPPVYVQVAFHGDPHRPVPSLGDPWVGMETRG